MVLEVFVASIIAFLAVLIGGQFLIPLLIQSGFIEQDINKKNRPLLPAGGGLILAFGFFIGVLALLFSVDYITSANINTLLLLVSLVTVIAISLIGFLDDLVGSSVRTSRENVLNIAKNYNFFNGGIRQWQKPLLTLVVALPLMAINWGAPIINIPFLGAVAINQLLFTFLIIPLSVIFAANAFNMLEGLNGLSVQMGLVAFVALAIFTYHMEAYTAFAIATVLSGALLAYIYYGSYPAKILPGDSLTYMIGAAFATTVIVGISAANNENMALFGIILVLPWLAEFLLKARKRFHANSWGILKRDGKLTSPHGNKIYSLTHIFLRTGKFTEWQIVSLLTLTEIIIASLALFFLW
jgi:UDP-N-acetylglucosamine--dolichyl-phosphate N-acetylglucosaminephosphotransferase